MVLKGTEAVRGTLRQPTESDMMASYFEAPIPRHVSILPKQRSTSGRLRKGEPASSGSTKAISIPKTSSGRCPVSPERLKPQSRASSVPGKSCRDRSLLSDLGNVDSDTALRDLPISWNIAPTRDVLAIRFNPPSKQRTLDVLRWGLIPNWAKDPANDQWLRTCFDKRDNIVEKFLVYCRSICREIVRTCVFTASPTVSRSKAFASRSTTIIGMCSKGFPGTDSRLVSTFHPESRVGFPGSAI